MPIANALVINDELLLKKCNKFEAINEPNGPIIEPNLGIDLINSITHSGLKKTDQDSTLWLILQQPIPDFDKFQGIEAPCKILKTIAIAPVGP